MLGSDRTSEIAAAQFSKTDGSKGGECPTPYNVTLNGELRGRPYMIAIYMHSPEAMSSADKLVLTLLMSFTKPRG